MLVHVECGPYRIIDKRNRAKDKESLDEAHTQYGTHVFKSSTYICFCQKQNTTVYYVCSLSECTLMHKNLKENWICMYSPIRHELCCTLCTLLLLFVPVGPIDFLVFFFFVQTVLNKEKGLTYSIIYSVITKKKKKMKS